MRGFNKVLLCLLMTLLLVTRSSNAENGLPRVILDRDVSVHHGDEGKNWTPSQEIIHKLEIRLKDFISHHQGYHNLSRKFPEYGMQYQGVVKDARQLIHFNAFCSTNGLTEDQLRSVPLEVNDGGDCYFEGAYDPKEDVILDFYVHGEA